jgi:hypothetical protein
MGDLEVLLAQLEAHRAKLPPPESGWPLAAFSEAFGGLPLFHRLGEPLRDPTTTLTRSEIKLEIARPKAGRARLGIDGCIFASFGVATYWEPPVVLAFGPAEVSSAARISVPWDSRGAGKVLNLAPESHEALIAEYSLVAPLDQNYLASHLATCFQEWERFLSGDRPKEIDPRGVFHRAISAPQGEETTWLTTPEARFEQDLFLGDQLLAVFVDADSPTFSPGDKEWRRTFQVLRRVAANRGAEYVPIQRSIGAANYQRHTSELVRRRMRASGYAL